MADYGNGLLVIDISDPANPTEVGSYPTDRAKGVFASGSHAYVADGGVADGGRGLLVIDVSDPANPTEVGSLPTGNAKDVYVSGSFACVAGGGDGLRVIDISDPVNPTEAGWHDTGDVAKGVFVLGSHAYVADQEDGLWIFNVSGLVPVILESMTAAAEPNGVRVSWTVADERNLSGYRLFRRTGNDAYRLISPTCMAANRGPHYDVLDAEVQSGERYHYRLVGVEMGGEEHILGEQYVEFRLYHAAALHQNHPNPFGPETAIRLTIPGPTDVVLSVYDPTGRLVVKLIDDRLGWGEWTARWDGRDANGQPVSSGVYYCRLRMGGAVQSQRMALIR